MRFAVTLITALVGLVAAAPVVSPSPESSFASNVKAGLRLLSIEDGAEPVWKTEDEKLALMRAETKFFDVTEVYEADKDVSQPKKKVSLTTFPAPSHTAAVKALIPSLSTTQMNTYLSSLTAYNTRYYTSSTGGQASTWIQSTLKTLAGSRTDITVTAFKHSWTQTSTIARFAGTSTTSPVTIIGAHMDSINLNSPSSGRAPGADDDGSGVVNLLDIFRVLTANGFKPTTPLEFHFYSGEEAGLLGSQAIASSYNSKGTKVKAMMQLDMTAYFKPGSTEVIALEADYIDSGLNSFVRQLAAAYSKLPVTMDKACGYACSDHASWYKYGYPTTMPFEAVTGNDNQNIHSTGDTTSVSGFSWSHSLEFAKVGLGFVYEMTA